MKGVVIIGQKNFEIKLQVVTRPILLAGFSSLLFDQHEIDELIAMSERFQDGLDVYMVLEEEKNLFARKYQLGGYPVYLLFINGKEMARFFGSANRQDLEAFYLKHTAAPESKQRYFSQTRRI